MSTFAALLLLFVASVGQLGVAESTEAAEAAETRWEWRTLDREGSAPLKYAVLLPESFDPGREYPVLLGLPPGGQDASMVEWCLENYWGAQARRLGWIVVSPAAPERQPLTGASGGPLLALLDVIERDYRAEGGAPHLVGVSNGGIGAFQVATSHPDRFLSLLVQPGMPGTEDVFAALDQIAELPVAFMVGGDDVSWRGEMRRARDRLVELGAVPPPFTAFEGEGHVPAILQGGALIFEQLEAFRGAVARASEARQAVEAVLADFHRAAAEADGTRYFAHFAPGAVFLGTDAGERWSVTEFKAYAEPFFSAGQGWTYVATERHVGLSAEATVAWFDERLHNEKYGEVRGSGVLRRGDDRWRIVQYNLAFPVPNDLAEELVERIREGEVGR